MDEDNWFVVNGIGFCNCKESGEFNGFAWRVAFFSPEFWFTKWGGVSTKYRCHLVVVEREGLS